MAAAGAAPAAAGAAASVAAAAAAGGYTTVICMANTKPVADSVEVLKDIKEEKIEIDGVELRTPRSAVLK